MRSGFREFCVNFSKNRSALFGLVVLLIVVGVALIGPFIYRVDPYSMVGIPFSPPSAEFLLGTDVSGRDILAGIINGASASLLIGVAVAISATIVGIVFGSIAGYYGGWIDDLLMRITEYFLTIPLFAFALILVAIFSPSLTTVIFAISLVSWPSIARLVRGEVLTQRGEEYVQACQVMGLSDMRIIFFEVLPNVISTSIVIGSLTVANAILTESGISFLGLSDPNHMTWGYMVGVARTAMFTAPWMIAIPGVAILLTVLAINLVGDGLNEALNPRLRR